MSGPPSNALYVQYGCGLSAPDGWVNFDTSPTLLIERLPLVGPLLAKRLVGFPASVRVGDIRKGLPLPNGSVQGLYASHVIEHLTYEDAKQAFVVSIALLRPGGTFRLVVPDLTARAERYLKSFASGDIKAAEGLLDGTGLGRRRKRGGLLGVLTQALGNSDHLWMWDELSMSSALHEAGFADVRRCSFGDSDDAMFALVEDEERFQDGGSPELAFECRRPIIESGPGGKRADR